MELAKKESGDDSITVATLGRITRARAIEIYRSIAKAFGGFTRLDASARTKRARKAAKVRWQRERENSKD